MKSINEVASALENVALFAVMFDPDDASSTEMLTSILEDLISTADGSAMSDTLVPKAKELLDDIQKGAADAPDKLNTFVSAMQSALEKQSDGQGSSEEIVASSSDWQGELIDDIDAELAGELIEKHRTLLQEIEGKLLEALNGSEEVQAETKAYLKSYLHNVKGEAGAVGFLGVQRVTHQTEEMLLSGSLSEHVEYLLLYKGWLEKTFDDFVEGGTPTRTSEEFIQQCTIQEAEEIHSADEAVGETTVVETDVQDLQSDEKKLQDLLSVAEFEETEYTISGDEDILTDFLIEADEHLNTIEELLLSKKDDFVLEDLEAIFRAVHSIKGGSSYFGLQDITRSSHDAENLMDKARNGKIVFNSALKRIILEYIGLQRKLIVAVRTAFENNAPLKRSKEAYEFINQIKDLISSENLIASYIVPGAEESGQEESPEPVVTSEPTSPTPEQPSQSPAVAEKKEEVGIPKKEEPKKKPTEKVQIKEFVKVDTTRLDKLLEYIGEMVISSSMLIKSCRDHLQHDEHVISNSHELERISREIQQIGMSMRLVPIKGLFQKMSRVVWDTAKKVKKDIKFEMEGADTELDRSVIDGLTDPLMHMVRNAVDHGIETAEERELAGKSAQGTVKLSAYHRAGSIYIEIQDDGKGLDPQMLIEKARAKDLIPESQALTDEEAYMLIFKAGFSTAAQVTDVSGRGVGMDVVRRNIENMRGRVRIESELGKGSTFIIELPLTLAIMEGIETTVGDESFIVPTLSIIEFLKPTADMIMHTIEQGETLKFRGQFLPIFRMSEIYNIQNAKKDPTDGILLVLKNGDQLVALLVDSVLGKLSAVIKSLGEIFQDVEGLSGCTIMPDGSIGLITDVATLVELAQAERRSEQITKTQLPGKEHLKNAVESGQPIQ